MLNKDKSGQQLFCSSRRGFMKQLAGLTLCCALPVSALRSNAEHTGTGKQLWSVNAYVNIGIDGIVTIYSPPAEMGQGTLTSLPLILAEEMDADWEQCRVEPSPATGDVYGDPVFVGMIFTVESRSVRTYYDRLRLFGYQARQVLLLNAAEKWNVPIEKLETRSGMVINTENNQQLSYGEIAAFGKLPDSLPEPAPTDFKQKSDFRLIGKVTSRRDVPSKVNGSAQYSIDIDLPGMVYAAVTRSPIHDATVKNVEENGARNLPGVLEILHKEKQVAVVATSYFAALKAREKIEVVWNKVGEVNNFDSEKAISINAEVARDLSVAGKIWDQGGDAKAVFADAKTVFAREYQSDFMYHAGIEPLNAVVWVKPDGESAEVWAGTQSPTYTVDTVAAVTGVKHDNVKLHRSLLGGGFGRRSVYGMDFVEDAAWLSAKLRRPVKVIWDRRDDIHNGYFRAMSAHYIRAAVTDEGRIQAWHHRVACEDPIKRFEPILYEHWNGIPLIGMTGSEHANFDGSHLEPAYELPNRDVEYLEVVAGIRAYAMRGVGSVPNSFAIESFLDELANEYKIDPLKLRLDLVRNSKRAQAVLNSVASMADWSRPRQDTGLGISYVLHAEAIVACVVEISLNEKSGEIKIHDVWISSDSGLVIQADNVKAQLEGGAIFGLSNALFESITIKQGLVQESNFHDYRLMRMDEAPRIHVQIIASEERPAGIGELGTIAAPAALANAFANLTGLRLRHMPFTASRVKQLLAQAS